MTSALNQAIVQTRDLSFSWEPGAPAVLQIDELEVERGARLFIKGPSGSGKSTLLNLLAGIINPQQGEVTVLGQSLQNLSPAGRDRFRADHIGFVFQMFNLIPYLSVVENVVLACRFSVARKDRVVAGSSMQGEAIRLLERLGLSDETIKRRSVTDLSVGQQQRVAVARALLGAPEIVIADEPTSALDADLRDKFLRLLMDECAVNQTTLLFVSHDGALATYFDQVLNLEEINRRH